MPVNVVVGMQRGDEGKGRFVDMLAEEHDIVARFNGGNNAGHTVLLPNNVELDLHLVPSGIAHENTVNVIGSGTFVNPDKLVDEIDEIRDKGVDVSTENLKISGAAHLILPHHIFKDVIRECGDQAQGSTKMGISPVASFKAARENVRVEDLKRDIHYVYEVALNGLREQKLERAKHNLDPINETEIASEFIMKAMKLAEYTTDTVLYLNKSLRQDRPSRVLAEGAQAFLLDIDHGMYPFVTSSSTTVGAVSTGLGVPPHFIDKVHGIVKAVPSHVGGGPFVTEIKDTDLLNSLHGDMSAIDAEKGTTTGRVRRLGNLDLPQIRRALMVNGTDENMTIALSKLDWIPRFGPLLDVCVAYERKGKTIDIAPDAAYKLDQSKPVYERLENWDPSIDITGVKTFYDLPKQAQKLVRFIEEQLETDIDMIGVGPRRDQVIVK